MANRLSQNLHALSQLNISIKNLDPAVLEMVLRKLDERGTQFWETNRLKDQLPSVASFLAFLVERIVVLQNMAVQAAGQDVKAEPGEPRIDARGNNRNGRANGNSHANGHGNGPNDSTKRSAERHNNEDAKRERPS